MALPDKLRKSGEICVDVYRFYWKCLIWPKYWIRPITKRIPSQLLFKIVSIMVPLFLPLTRLLIKVPKIGYYLKFTIPVVNHEDDFPALNKEQQFEWSILDTFDMLSAKYDKPQKKSALKKWFAQSPLSNIVISGDGILVGRGTKE